MSKVLETEPVNKGTTVHLRVTGREKAATASKATEQGDEAAMREWEGETTGRQ